MISGHSHTPQVGSDRLIGKDSNKAGTDIMICISSYGSMGVFDTLGLVSRAAAVDDKTK